MRKGIEVYSKLEYIKQLSIELTLVKFITKRYKHIKFKLIENRFMNECWIFGTANFWSIFNFSGKCLLLVQVFTTILFFVCKLNLKPPEFLIFLIIKSIDNKRLAIPRRIREFE